ncbi:uncharacterized protein VTP21DRAFT_3121 [Calcarisporiella thermophila]|uniref:uncharacterized protein n=1 Tax=Calcarisporiella thermophila TaxID=911321 RepID=UPI00374469F3
MMKPAAHLLSVRPLVTAPRLMPSLAARRNYSTSKDEVTRKETIGFIGLGQMGFHMANNLYKKSNVPFIVYDVNKATAERFVKQLKLEKEVVIARCPVEVAEKAGTVITMLPASPHVKDVYVESTEALLPGLDQDSVVIDSSTIDQAVAKEMAKAVGSKGAIAVDAPVSGGVPGAEAATLTFMVGAALPDHFEVVRPILARMGRNIVYCGANGSGQIAKICNNMLLGISMIGVSETMNLGVRLGMDPHLLAGIINTSTGRCWSSDTYNPCPGVMETVPASKGYEGGFGSALMAKDLRLAVNAANDCQASIPLGALSQQIYNQLSNTKEFKTKDFSSVYKWLNDKRDL